MSDAKILKFLELVGLLKTEKRAGWVIKQHEECETIAGHMYRMAITCFIIDSIEGMKLNRVRCMELALIHDLAECITGDITPHDGIDSDKKHEMELDAMKTITSLLPTTSGDYIMELFKEYEERQTLESKFIKECDLFDVIQQAFEYEKSLGKKHHFQEFFDTVGDKLKIPFFVNLKRELDRQRVEFENDSSINFKKSD